MHGIVPMAPGIREQPVHRISEEEDRIGSEGQSNPEEQKPYGPAPRIGDPKRDVQAQAGGRVAMGAPPYKPAVVRGLTSREKLRML